MTCDRPKNPIVIISGYNPFLFPKLLVLFVSLFLRKGFMQPRLDILRLGIELRWPGPLDALALSPELGTFHSCATATVLWLCLKANLFLLCIS